MPRFNVFTPESMLAHGAALGQMPWIGTDLDGTLATYVGWIGPEHIGAPVEAQVARVRGWLAEGRRVKIVTARVTEPDPVELGKVVATIRAWCAEHLGQELEITATKDFGMVELYDDRCVQVEANTGALVGRSTRGLGQTGEFPDGKLTEYDEGAIVFEIGAYEGRVMLHFGAKAVQELGFTPDQAEHVAAVLLEEAAKARTQ